MTDPTYAPPQTDAEIEAMKRALAAAETARQLQELQAVQALFQSEVFTGFQGAIATAAARPLPPTSATGRHLASLVENLGVITSALGAEIAAAEAVLNPAPGE